MIISFLNQKGGTGKTTVSTNVAAELAYRGFKTLFVDADPQGTAMRGASERPEDKPLLYNVIGMPNTSISQQIPKMHGISNHLLSPQSVSMLLPKTPRLQRASLRILKRKIGLSSTHLSLPELFLQMPEQGVCPSEKSIHALLP